MTAALYNQDLLDDPETPVFNKVLDLDCALLEFVLAGDFMVPQLANTTILELAFEVDAAHYELVPSQIPTVAQIEADIDAGIVPLTEPESRHRSEDDDDDEPAAEELEPAARFGDEGSANKKSNLDS